MLISLAVGRGLSLPSYRSAVYDQVGLTAAPILLVYAAAYQFQCILIEISKQINQILAWASPD